MTLQGEHLTLAEAEAWIKEQKQPRLGDYFIELDPFSGKFAVWLVD